MHGDKAYFNVIISIFICLNLTDSRKVTFDNNRSFPHMYLFQGLKIYGLRNSRSYTVI